MIRQLLLVLAFTVLVAVGGCMAQGEGSHDPQTASFCYGNNCDSAGGGDLGAMSDTNAEALANAMGQLGLVGTQVTGVLDSLSANGPNAAGAGLAPGTDTTNQPMPDGTGLGLMGAALTGITSPIANGISRAFAGISNAIDSAVESTGMRYEDRQAFYGFMGPAAAMTFIGPLVEGGAELQPLAKLTEENEGTGGGIGYQMQARGRIANDPFIQRPTGTVNFHFTEWHPDLRAGGEYLAWQSERKVGLGIEQAAMEGNLPKGGFSLYLDYEIPGVGFWRISDHWGVLQANFKINLSPEEIISMGGKYPSTEGGKMIVFPEPVAGFHYYDNH